MIQAVHLYRPIFTIIIMDLSFVYIEIAKFYLISSSSLITVNNKNVYLQFLKCFKYFIFVVCFE